MQRIVVALILSIFIICTSMGIVNPVVPIYAEKLGATYTDLGLIGVAWSLPYCIFPILAGMWSNRIGRLRSFLIGVVTCTIVPMLFTISSSLLHIALTRLLHGFGMSFLWAPGEALISDVTNEDERAKYLGLFNASWSLGYFLGPIVCALVIDEVGYFGVFWLSFIIGIPSIFIIILLREDVKAGQSIGGGLLLQQFKRVFVVGSHLYVAIISSSVVLAMIYSIYPAYLSGLSFSDSEISMFIGILAATRALGFWSISIMRRINERKLIISYLLLQTVTSILVIEARDFSSIAVVMALMGYATSVQIPVIMSMVSRLLKGEVGLPIGVMEAMFGFGWVMGPGIGGFFADYTSWDGAPYLVMSLISALSLIFFALQSSARKG
ncbi:MAG: MFS transporter [Candidatus Nezhaarchaeota archaeon]|nr:MFS transporter [Candidatus Nezhaarchaeota archaeon]MCX8141771.1 MFS transporter [Candidatus Nezhaarchaeota archaeon]MDW8050451.1 MFS transporter [Nitrososphaerota archaeon]